jgi:hypothetical protein
MKLFTFLLAGILGSILLGGCSQEGSTLTGSDTEKSLIQGAQGEVGPVGPQGAQGEPGDRGIQGLVGLTGSAGTQGTQGIAGLIGSTGATGAQGIQGIPGPSGPQGLQGIPGPIGPQGPGAYWLLGVESNFPMLVDTEPLGPMEIGSYMIFITMDNSTAFDCTLTGGWNASGGGSFTFTSTQGSGVSHFIRGFEVFHFGPGFSDFSMSCNQNLGRSHFSNVLAVPIG